MKISLSNHQADKLTYTVEAPGGVFTVSPDLGAIRPDKIYAPTSGQPSLIPDYPKTPGRLGSAYLHEIFTGLSLQEPLI